jgi:hypothetical protein
MLLVYNLKSGAIETMDPTATEILVVLVASSAGQSAPATRCQPWATGRVWRTAHQNRADDQRLAVVSGAALSLLIIELVPGSNSC